MALRGLRLVSKEFCPPLELPVLFASTIPWVVLFCLLAIIRVVLRVTLV